MGGDHVTFFALFADDSKLFTQEQASGVAIKVRIADLQSADRVLHPDSDYLVWIFFGTGSAGFQKINASVCNQVRQRRFVLLDCVSIEGAQHDKVARRCDHQLGVVGSGAGQVQHARPFVANEVPECSSCRNVEWFARGYGNRDMLIISVRAPEGCARWRGQHDFKTFIALNCEISIHANVDGLGCFTSREVYGSFGSLKVISTTRRVGHRVKINGDRLCRSLR